MLVRVRVRRVQLERVGLVGVRLDRVGLDVVQLHVVRFPVEFRHEGSEVRHLYEGFGGLAVVKWIKIFL